MRISDFQTSYQAVPEVARGYGMEHAGSEYRLVQNLIQNRQESVNRPNQVIATGLVNQPVAIRPVERSRDEFQSRGQARGIDRKNERLEPTLYSPFGKSIQKSLDQSAGMQMDMLA